MDDSRVITISTENLSKQFCIKDNSLSFETFYAYFPQAIGLSFKINSTVYKVHYVDNKFILNHLVNEYKLIDSRHRYAKNQKQSKDQLFKIKLVKKYFYKNYTYEEICGILEKRHDVTVSVRTIKRILKACELKRKNIQENDLEQIVVAIIQEVNGDGNNLGYRALWHRLGHIYNIQVKQNSVLQILRLVDPEGVEARSRRRLKRRQYSAPGSNFIWHIDGNDKLKKDGFAIHACIDGFSKKIVWLKVGRSNNNSKIVAKFYLEAVENLKTLPTLLRSDRGTENTIVELLQIALRSNHNDELSGEKSYLSGKSTANQRIEHYWCILRHQLLDSYIEYFNSMRHRFVLDISDPLHIELLRFCFGHQLQNSLDNIKKEWNDHRIRKQNNRNIPGAIPNVMYYWPEKYGGKQCGKSVDINGLQALHHDYSIESKLYNDDIEIYARSLLHDCFTPSTCEEAEKMFITLVNAVPENLSNRYSENKLM